MLSVAADSRSVTIPNTVTRGWPAWLWPSVAVAPLYLCFAAVYFLMNTPGAEWFRWFWVAYPGVYLLAVWLGSIERIDVDPAQIAVRRHLRSQTARMDDVLRIDARKMPWRFAARYRPAPYAMDVWLTGYRHWRLQYVEPEAGDRLMAVLNGYRKPIWILPPA